MAIDQPNDSCMSNCKDWPVPCPNCGCECHAAQVPDGAKLTDQEQLDAAKADVYQWTSDCKDAEYLQEVAEVQRDAALEQVRALAEVIRRLVPQPFHCEDCGYFVGSDEDGCCFTCGADLEISDFDVAIAAAKEVQDANR